MDRRQSVAESATVAAEQIFPERGLGRRWEPVRARCYTAADAYLTLTEQLDQAEATGAAVPQGQARTADVVRRLTEAAHGVDEYYRGNQAQLEEAVAVVAMVPRLADQVTAAAASVRGQAAESPYAHYRSIRRASTAVDEALITLRSARDGAAVGAVREAANRLDAVTKELADALAQAPSRSDAAKNAITSVRTRLAAVRTRADGIAAAYSTLLREFNAASSADLADNERESQRAIAAADDALSGARAAAAENDPELALELTTTARGNLAAAEQQVDAVTKRLTLLREVREKPQDKAEAVRFRLRDAQMLAVGRGLVTEWGSVLDAQAERIDRVTGALTGRHPDYWAYVTELDAVAEFIAGVVDRMRKQQGPRRE